MPQTLLSARGVTRAIGARTILAGVSLAIDDHSKLALVGPNGSGKSTLLALLAGREAPDSGRVVRARDAAVLHLPQLDGADDAASVRATLHERLGVAGAAARMDALAARLAAGEDVVDAHAHALDEWLARGGADLDARLDRAAADAGLDPGLLDRSAGTLSGGQRARAMLAAVTTARADVLLLDEPANHLDADGLARLRALLLARAGGLVLVAHDRALLAAVSNRVVALDGHDGSATAFGGGWATYEDERDRAHRHAVQAHERAAAERDRVTALARAARQRASQGMRNARSENDTNLRRLYEQSTAGSERLAGQLARKAARIEVPDRPWREKPTHLPHAAAAGSAGVVAALEGAVLRRGDFTVAEVAQERSSLLDAAAPDVVSAVRAHAGLGEREARAALAAMGLSKQLVAHSPATLSPGERTRAELAAATAAGARLLLLDEPTNHLDVEALEALESALDRWPGALVVATHDARLRDNLRLHESVDVAALPRPQ